MTKVYLSHSSAHWASVCTNPSIHHPQFLAATGGHRLLAVAESPPAAGRRRGGRGRAHAVSKESRRARRKRIFDAVRKTPPAATGSPDSHDQAEVAAMLREIGIALVEVEQPTQLVKARLALIAAQYTTKPVRIVVLPTMLLIQIGTDGYEVDRVDELLAATRHGRSHRRHRQPGQRRRDHPGRRDRGDQGGAQPAATIRAGGDHDRICRHHSGFRHGHQPHLGFPSRLPVPGPDRRRASPSWAGRFRP